MVVFWAATLSFTDTSTRALQRKTSSSDETGLNGCSIPLTQNFQPESIKGDNESRIESDTRLLPASSIVCSRFSPSLRISRLWCRAQGDPEFAVELVSRTVDTSFIVCRYLLFITYFLHGELYTRTGLQLPTTSYRTRSIIFPPTDHNQLSNIISRHTEYCTIDITLIVGLICASQPYIPNTGPHSYRPLADH
ncbi:hypothetical protein HL42_4884 [Trichophyton rubrum]|nr:hypothetical protein HL42_4884 [Trichophyton rubrum]